MGRIRTAAMAAIATVWLCAGATPNQTMAQMTPPAPIAHIAPGTYPFQDARLTPDQRIANLLSLMTVDEKIDALSTNSSIPRLGVASFGSSEGIHGVVQRGNAKWHFPAIPTTQFPQPPGMGETWDPDIVRQASGVEGFEGRYITQTQADYHHPMLMLWGPQADLMRDPRWGRSEEVYGEDPFLNGTMVAAFARGLQGDDPKVWQAAALMKHFLANSNENGRGSSSSDFDERLFYEYYSVPFRMGFQDGGARGVMDSYNAWNGTPMAVNPVINDVVVGQWGADVVSSDGGAVTNLVKLYHRYPTQEAAVVACIKAGINQFLDVYKDEAHAAIKDGTLSEADIDAVLKHKFQVTIKLGLLDPPDASPYAHVGEGPEPWTTDKDRAVSARIALESITLLKNDYSALPLDKTKLKSVAVVGPLADSVHWDWYGGYPPYKTTPLDGIKAALGPGVTVTYAEGGDAAVAAAKGADAVIVVVGNDPTCGPNMANDWNDAGTKPCADPGDGREGRDRETLNLAQEGLVKQVLAVNPKTVMVLVSSFPFAIPWSQANVPAILHMTHASQDEGSALAKVIFGDYNPGGHLTETWPVSEAQLPPMMDYDIRHGRTYLYAKDKPLYPFGYGLSYTTFSYSHLKTSAPSVAKDGTVTVSVDVINTGKRAGDTVVQLYVHHDHSAVERPDKALAGFKRVGLKPGETRRVDIALKASQLAYWAADKKAFVVEAEPVEVLIGDSSADIKLKGTISVR